MLPTWCYREEDFLRFAPFQQASPKSGATYLVVETMSLDGDPKPRLFTWLSRTSSAQNSYPLEKGTSMAPPSKSLKHHEEGLKCTSTSL